MSAKKTIARITLTFPERDIIIAAVDEWVTKDAGLAPQGTYIGADLKRLCTREPGIILSTGRNGLQIIYDALFVFHGSTEPLILHIAKALQRSQDNALVVFACNG